MTKPEEQRGLEEQRGFILSIDFYGLIVNDWYGLMERILRSCLHSGKNAIC